MPSVFDPWGPLPDVAHMERALEVTGWAYESCYETAEQMYREKYGDLPCIALEPDGGTLAAMTFLKRAVCLLEAERVERSRGCDRPAVRRQDGWNAPPSTPCKFCSVPIGEHRGVQS